MFNIREIIKQVAAAAAAAFGAIFPAASVATDLTLTQDAIVAGVSAGFAVVLTLVGNLTKQLIERARGILRTTEIDAAAALDAAAEWIAEAKKAIG